MQLLFQQRPPPSLLVVIDPVKIERKHARPNPEQPRHPCQKVDHFHFAAGGLAGGGQKVQPVVVPPFDNLTDAVHRRRALLGTGGQFRPGGTFIGAQRDGLAQFRQFEAHQAAQLAQVRLPHRVVPRRRSEPLEFLRESKVRLLERFAVCRAPGQQVASLAGLGVLQHREELIHGLAELLAFGGSVNAAGKTAPSHRSHHHAHYRGAQPDKGQRPDNPVSKSVDHARPCAESSAHASGQ